MELKDVVNGTYIIANNIVNVDGDVNMFNKGLTHIPWKFGTVTCNFLCHGNRLATLWGAPHTVGRSFGCNNNSLTSLKYCPKIVGGDFYCNNNLLTSLRYCTKNIGGSIECSNNTLISLECCPKPNGEIFCRSNQIISVKNLPLDILMKLNGCDHLIDTIKIPKECKSLVKNLLNPPKQRKQTTIKDRLNSIST